MTWKSYAAASGATILAGWLASSPPVNVVDGRPVAPARSPRAAVSPSTASDIQEQASRLQARIRRETSYARPERNPFRFSEAAPAASPIAIAEPSNVPATAAGEFVPPPPVVTLVGMAQDQTEQGSDRTAILSSPNGVLLVRKGDEVLGQYRVTTVDEQAVVLTSIADGSTLRLSLAR